MSLLILHWSLASILLLVQTREIWLCERLQDKHRLSNIAWEKLLQNFTKYLRFCNGIRGRKVLFEILVIETLLEIRSPGNIFGDKVTVLVSTYIYICLWVFHLRVYAGVFRWWADPPKPLCHSAGEWRKNVLKGSWVKIRTGRSLSNYRHR